LAHSRASFEVAAMADGAAPQKPGPRHHGEVSMESFIKHQMMVILQPFIEQVQHMDTRMAQQEERSETTDGSVDALKAAIDRSQAIVQDFGTAIQKVDTKIDGVRDGLARSISNHDLLHQGVEHMNCWIQRVQTEVEQLTNEMRELKSFVGCLELRVDTVQGSLGRTDDHVKLDVESLLERLGTEVQELRRSCGHNAGELQRFREDFAHKSEFLQETRTLVDKNTAAASGLHRNHDLMTAREADMRRQLDNLKSQWSKLQPAVEAMNKDNKFLRQRLDQHDVVVHTLQQNHATNHSNHEILQGSHDRSVREVQALQQSMKAVRMAVEENRDALARAGAFANALHSGLDKACADVEKANAKAEALEKQHGALKEALGRTNDAAVTLHSEVRRTNSDVVHQRHEVEKTNEAIDGLRRLLDANSERLSSVIGDVGVASEAVQRLDSSMELCKAGFSGLQKGFVEAGTHLQSRPLTLPRLSTDARLSPSAPRSARQQQPGPLAARLAFGGGSGMASLGAPQGGAAGGSPGAVGGGGEKGAWSKPSGNEEFDSTQASVHSRMSSTLSDC